MNFPAKFNQLSVKIRLATFISVLWLLFWAVAGWEGGRFFEGLAFGGIPPAITWGFWWIAIHSYQEASRVNNLQAIFKDDSPEKRKFFRLEYPPTKRPTLKFGEKELEITDISEKGLKLLNNKQIELDSLIYGKAVLLSGRSISVDGEVVWSRNNEIGLLMVLIPSSIIAEERRVLSGKKFLPEARLKPERPGVGFGVEKVS